MAFQKKGQNFARMCPQPTYHADVALDRHWHFRGKVKAGTLLVIQQDKPAALHSVVFQKLAQREGHGTHKVVARDTVPVPDGNV